MMHAKTKERVQSFFDTIDRRGCKTSNDLNFNIAQRPNHTIITTLVSALLTQSTIWNSLYQRPLAPLSHLVVQGVAAWETLDENRNETYKCPIGEFVKTGCISNAKIKHAAGMSFNIVQMLATLYYLFANTFIVKLKESSAESTGIKEDDSTHSPDKTDEADATDSQ